MKRFRFLFAAPNYLADRRIIVVRCRVLGSLACAFPAFALLSGGTARAAPTATEVSIVAAVPFAEFIAEAAQRLGISAAWIRAVMQVESAGNGRAMSSKGAMGLMQIMPHTWTYLRARYGLGADPFDPHDNILAGAAYLREMLDRYGSPGFLAAYNTGPERYDEYLATGRTLPGETQAYVATLAPLIENEAISVTGLVAVAARSWTDAPLFTGRTNNGSGVSDTPFQPSSARSTNDDSAHVSTPLTPPADHLFVATTAQNVKP